MKIYYISCFLLIVSLGGCASNKDSLIQEDKVGVIHQVCSASHCIDVELADDDVTRQQGLMHRSDLESESGMLFVFPDTGYHQFRMKNTLIPLDMIWINDQGKITDVQKALPCSSDPCPIYTPRAPANYVLEIGAETALSKGFIIGTTATFR